MKFSGKKKQKIFEGGLYSWLEKLFDAFMLNILWLIFCIPIITIVASTAAFYHTFNKVIRCERGHLFHEFIKNFRLNLIQGIMFFFVFSLTFFLLILNKNISYDIGGLYISLFLICLYFILIFIVCAITLYVFPILSRFEMKLISILKLSVYMCFRYFPSTLLMLALAVFSFFAVYYFWPFIFFVSVFVLYPFSLVMEKVLIRHTPITSDMGDNDKKEKWYISLTLKGEEKQVNI